MVQRLAIIQQDAKGGHIQTLAGLLPKDNLKSPLSRSQEPNKLLYHERILQEVFCTNGGEPEQIEGLNFVQKMSYTSTTTKSLADKSSGEPINLANKPPLPKPAAALFSL